MCSSEHTFQRLASDATTDVSIDLQTTIELFESYVLARLDLVARLPQALSCLAAFCPPDLVPDDRPLRRGHTSRRVGLVGNWLDHVAVDTDPALSIDPTCDRWEHDTVDVHETAVPTLPATSGRGWMSRAENVKTYKRTFDQHPPTSTRAGRTRGASSPRTA